MLAENAENAESGPGCRLILQPINSETEFAKASQGPADQFIVRGTLPLIMDFIFNGKD